MSFSDSQSVEEATVPRHHPDNKTRRYDRQLRLWAASGQAALESSRILVISASATSTSILKNLVLPGIGHFTVIDDQLVSQQDAGNNFFLDGFHSIGKSRAAEAVTLLCELNDSVDGKADASNFEQRLDSDPTFLTSFSLIIAHNLHPNVLEKLSDFLWSDLTYPALIIVRSAGFLAEFFIQFHEHHVIESHSETTPSLRIDKPFPSLLQHAMSLNFDVMDPTDHGHVPYVVILIRALEDWKRSHQGNPPKTYQEKQAFKKSIRDMKVKNDEENFDEAESQAYRCWSETPVPPAISSLFSDPVLSQLGPDLPQFYHLLSALRQFTLQPPYTLPLTSTLPDMKSDTTSYIHLQKLYKSKAEEDKKLFRGLVTAPVDEEIVDLFVRNSHHLRLMRGGKWGIFDKDKHAIASALAESPKAVALHLAFSALSAYIAKHSTSHPIAPSPEALFAEVQLIVGQGVDLPEQEMNDIIGEIARSPTADIPNTAAFVGGVIAQEAIKMITKQYVPQMGYCTIDLVETWTGVIGA